MVSNIPNSTYVKGGEGYNGAPEGSGATGKERRDTNIPLQIWQARAGKAMNILQEKVRFKVDPAKGGVVMETGSDKGNTDIMFGDVGSLADGVIHPGNSAKGLLINRQG